MNKIIESFLDTHTQEYGLENMKKETRFEHFVNRLIINKYSLERFNPDDIMTGDGEIGEYKIFCVNEKFHVKRKTFSW
ncbi:hypothetical protein [Metasolibacillus sp. FSL K6-0083]|uniref:hypothetical protein n=1 Tax=Metasolibacillus sp. FSL K6-0083 TaxID=2921416 RepID=UPI003159BBA2